MFYGHTYKENKMKSSLSQAAVMNVEKGEEIVGGPRRIFRRWGFTNFWQRKKMNGEIEWAHFIQRDNGLKERVMRGTVKTRGELDTVIEVANKNLSKLFGVTLQATDYDMYTLDGKKTSSIKQ
jgi:hypothetical protein